MSLVTSPLRKPPGVVAGDLDHAAVGEKRCLHAKPFDILLPEPAAKRKRCRQGLKLRKTAPCMAETYDLILKGGTVVNQDGEGAARPRHPRRPLCRHRRPRARLGRRGDRLPRPAPPAGGDRQPRAFPRARPHPQGGPGIRLARRRARRRHRGVRDAEHRSRPPPRPKRSPTRSRAAITACIAISPSMSARRARTPAHLGELEMLPGVCRGQGVHGFLHRLAADRGRRRRARRAQNASAAAPPSIPRTSTACASA